MPYDLPGFTEAYDDQAQRVLIFPEDQSKQKLLGIIARLTGQRIIARCPRCQKNYVPGRGHVGSDWCLVHENLLREAAAGYVPVPPHLAPSIELANIGHRVGLGAATTLTKQERMGLKRKPYRGVSARKRVFAPKWASFVARFFEHELEINLSDRIATVLRTLASNTNVLNDIEVVRKSNNEWLIHNVYCWFIFDVARFDMATKDIPANITTSYAAGKLTRIIQENRGGSWAAAFEKVFV